MSTTTTTGTTLEILDAFPAGLEVQYTEEERLNGVFVARRLYRAIVIGYTHDPLEDEREPTTQIAISLLSDRSKWRWVQPSKFLPVLRPFSALLEPLPDGSIVALVVASFLVNDWAAQYRYVARKTPLNGVSVDVFEQCGDMDDEQQVSVVNLYDDWNWDVLRIEGEEKMQAVAYNPSTAIDYLRRNHFALPVNGRPLVEGVDFIAKP